MKTESNLSKRISFFTFIFESLQETNSRIEKQEIVDCIPAEYKEDFDFILEVLAGRHKFGYTYYCNHLTLRITAIDETFTIKQVLEYLLTPMRNHDLRESVVYEVVQATCEYADFFEPIVNRTLKLGIGNSILEKPEYSAMLAKKFQDVTLRNNKAGYFLTEKLDGNRCIAHYEDGVWKFTSRNNKPMHVQFNMVGLPTDLIYDGEILAPEQVALSKMIHSAITESVVHQYVPRVDFNSTSGMINRHTLDKTLVYNIFDLQIDLPYHCRREILDSLLPIADNVRILPLLLKTTSDLLYECVFDVLDVVTGMSGEGLMINNGDSLYEHKRTDGLLKLKKVQTMDMRVTGIMEGSGKYEYCVGALTTHCTTDDGKEIYCKVGTGLSDEQRLSWIMDTTKIVGKIIEVAYFDISQDSNYKGTNVYSLRFPRLKKVRDDKGSTSGF